MIRKTWHRSRLHRRCDCGAWIKPGDYYLSCVASPHHDDLGNPHWWRLFECEGCATKRGNVRVAA